jgi:preprotein translocase subunit SecY
MSEEHTQPPIGQGARFVAALSTATVLGGIALGAAYRALELILTATADRVDWWVGGTALLVLIGCVAWISHTLQRG